VNNELERIWKAAGVVQFDVSFRNMPAGTKKHRENFNHDSHYVGLVLNPTSAEYEATMPATFGEFH
jgi:hypothetical protein